MRPHTKVRPRHHSSLPALPSRLPEGEQPLGVGPGDGAGVGPAAPSGPRASRGRRGALGPHPARLDPRGGARDWDSAGSFCERREGPSPAL